MKQIQITFKEAQSLNFKNITIEFDDNFKLNYYRPIKTLYVVRHWFNENDYVENEFNSLKEAKIFADKKYKDYEILKYKDISFRYWEKQQIYQNGELMEEYEQ